MEVKFLDFTREADYLVKNGLMKDIEEVILSGHYLFGPKAKLLEDRLSERFNSNVALVGSGTDAIYLALRACGLGEHSRIIIPAFSAIPTAAAVKMLIGSGYSKPIYVDVDCYGLLDIEKLEEELITNSMIDAVVVVHLYGNAVNSLKVKEICSKYNIVLIEDCAQAFDSTIEGIPVGTIGNAGAFSFYPSKLLGIFGDGGMVVSSNVQVIQKVKELRFYGQVDKYVMGDSSGINSRMDEIQSTILLKKLDYIDEQNKARERLLKKYNEFFNSVGTYHTHYICKSETGCNPHLFPFCVSNRKKFMRIMAEKGIETLIHYPFNLPSAMEKKVNGDFPMAENLANSIVSIPFNIWMTDEEIEYVLKSAEEALRG